MSLQCNSPPSETSAKLVSAWLATEAGMSPLADATNTSPFPYFMNSPSSASPQLTAQTSPTFATDASSVTDGGGGLELPAAQVPAVNGHRAASGGDDEAEVAVGCKYMVANLALSITNAELREMFEKFGALTRAVVIVNMRGESRGFGFITFEEEGAGEKMMAEMDHKEVRGMKIRILLPKESDEVQVSSEVLVRKCPISVTDEQLASIFGAFAPIVSLEAQRKSGSWRNTGRQHNKFQFVRIQYESATMAQTVVDALNGVLELPCPDNRNAGLMLRLPVAARLYFKPRDNTAMPLGAAACSNNNAPMSSPIAVMPGSPLLGAMSPYCPQLPYGTMMVAQQPQVQPQYHHAAPVEAVPLPQPQLIQYGSPVSAQPWMMEPVAHVQVPLTYIVMLQPEAAAELPMSPVFDAPALAPWPPVAASGHDGTGTAGNWTDLRMG